MKEKRKKILTIILIVAFIVLLVARIFYGIFLKKEEKKADVKTTTTTSSATTITKSEKFSDEVDFDFSNVEEIKTKDLIEYSNQFNSLIQEWDEAFKNRDSEITQDLWSNEEQQKKYVLASKKFLKISTQIQKLSCDEDNFISYEISTAMDWFIEEANEQIAILDELKELQKNGTPTEAQAFQEYQESLNDLQSRLEVTGSSREFALERLSEGRESLEEYLKNGEE